MFAPRLAQPLARMSARNIGSEVSHKPRDRSMQYLAGAVRL